MIRCAYCKLFNSLECENKHKNFPNDEICKDFSLDPKRLDEYRQHVINEKIQEILIEFEDAESRQLEFLSTNNFKFVTIQKATFDQTFPRYAYDDNGNMISVNITTGDEFKSKPEQDKCGCDFVYRGNVKVKFWENQTVKEAIDEYYKSINKTPVAGDIITVNSNNDKAYVYLNDWEEIK